ncbi:MAG: hypothetical protein M1457_02845, partial [bacterium]|nr:hypothetical protein [bacterium]
FFDERRVAFESKITREPGAPPYMRTALKKQALAAEGQLTLTAGEQKITKSVGNAFTAKWCLCEAVQRLGGSAAKPVQFSLIDEYDQVRPGATLSFRREADIAMNAKPTLLTAYQVIGEGIVPTVYWVDAAHRLLFVISGIEVYILAEENGAKIQYPQDPSIPMQEGLRRSERRGRQGGNR